MGNGFWMEMWVGDGICVDEGVDEWMRTRKREGLGVWA
jgi:hypothetical protein